MKDKTKTVVNGIIISSIIFIIIGLYYFIESSIPYQDPPMDLIISYKANQIVGNTCLYIGLGLLVFYIIMRIIIMLINKKNK